MKKENKNIILLIPAAILNKVRLNNLSAKEEMKK